MKQKSRLPIFQWTILGFCSCVLSLILKLRYRIEVKGLKEVCLKYQDSKEGILFLPNHPALMDPAILGSLLWRKFHIRPIMLDKYYYLPVVHSLMKLCRAVSLPVTTEFTNKWKKKRVDAVYEQIPQGLLEGENFLIYPAGKLKSGGPEVLGGTSLIHNILQKTRSPNIVLVRTTGLWGSQFSRAYSEHSPDLIKTFLRGVKTVFKNGIFFVPKRTVQVTFSLAPSDFPYQAPSRIELNRYLENWYNAPWGKAGEQIQQVSLTFWKREVLVPLDKTEKKEEEGDLTLLPKETRDKVIRKIAEICNKNPEEVYESATLGADLGMDSLDFMQISLFLEQRYDVVGVPATHLRTVRDILLAVLGKKQKKEQQACASKRVALYQTGRPTPSLPKGKTISEVFLSVCKKMRGFYACSDALSGTVSYSRLKLGALILAEEIKKLPGKHIGILLPSSVGAYTVILATFLAKKVPVMLNWTTGTKTLDYADQLMGFSNVITSERFLENLENGDLGKIEDKLLFLETIRENLSLKDKLYGKCLSLLPPSLLLWKNGLKEVSSEDTAVVLFTSGSESLPKAVPLSHKNILADQRAVLQAISLENSDIFYGILPPFHSFGFSITGLLPILSGMNVVYSPNPTDSQRLAGEIYTYGITIFCSAPSFMKAVFQLASAEKLQSVRLFVCGAEKAPEDLFSYVENTLHKKIIEGYGITECSPVVTLNSVYGERKGIGKPLPSIEIGILSENEKEMLPVGKEGEICIYGENVFSGYLGTHKNPFITLDGKKWYRSGDKGYLDEQGNVFLSGRLTRFVKIGGEMVSLGGLEEDLHKIVQEKNWAKGNFYALAVVASERDSAKPEIVVFSTLPLEKEEINLALREQGHGRIAKIQEVKFLESIPATGTGKIQYRLLEEMLKNTK